MDSLPPAPKRTPEPAAKSEQEPHPNAGVTTHHTTTATVQNSRLTSFVSPANGKKMQMVMVTWKNTGSTPIRVVDAEIVHRDSSNAVLGTHNYTIFSASDTSPGVAPGETYSTPAGEGFLLPGFRGLPNYKESKTVRVRITAVLEHSGI